MSLMLTIFIESCRSNLILYRDELLQEKMTGSEILLARVHFPMLRIGGAKKFTTDIKFRIGNSV